MMQVEPRMKPPIEECCCGCGLTGRPRARAWKDGLSPHVKRCPCRRCMAPRYKQRATQREHKIGKAVGGRRNIGSGAFGGVDTIGGIVDVEETAAEAVVRGLRRWWFSKTVQTKTTRLLEHKLKPRALVCSWDHKPRLVVMEYEDWADLCAMALDAQDDVA